MGILGLLLNLSSQIVAGQYTIPSTADARSQVPNFYLVAGAGSENATDGAILTKLQGAAGIYYEGRRFDVYLSANTAGATPPTNGQGFSWNNVLFPQVSPAGGTIGAVWRAPLGSSSGWGGFTELRYQDAKFKQADDTNRIIDVKFYDLLLGLRIGTDPKLTERLQGWLFVEHFGALGDHGAMALQTAAGQSLPDVAYWALGFKVSFQVRQGSLEVTCKGYNTDIGTMFAHGTIDGACLFGPSIAVRLVPLGSS